MSWRRSSVPITFCLCCGCYAFSTSTVAATYFRQVGSEEIVLPNGGRAWINYVETNESPGVCFGSPLTNCRPADVYPKIVDRHKYGFINLPQSDRPSADISGLKLFGNLRSLQYTSKSVPAEAVKELGKLHGLTHLDLTDSAIGNGDADGLQDLTALRVLELGKTNLTDAGASRIARLSNLTELALTSNSLTDKGAASLGTLKNLGTLSLGGSGITDEGAAMLTRLTKLKKLQLRLPQITGAACQAIGALSELEELAIADARFDAAGIKHLAGLRKLRSLKLWNARLEASALDGLASHPALETIILNKCNVGNEDVKFLSSVPHLKKVGVRWTRVTRSGWAPLFDLPNLADIDFDNEVPQAARESRALRTTSVAETPLERSADGKLGLRLSVLKGARPGEPYSMAEVYDTSTGKQVGNRLIYPNPAHRMACRSFSPDGKFVAMGGAYSPYHDYNTGEITVWEVGSGELVWYYPGAREGDRRIGSVRKVAFSANSREVYFEADPFQRLDGR